MRSRSSKATGRLKSFDERLLRSAVRSAFVPFANSFNVRSASFAAWMSASMAAAPLISLLLIALIQPAFQWHKKVRLIVFLQAVRSDVLQLGHVAGCLKAAAILLSAEHQQSLQK